MSKMEKNNTNGRKIKGFLFKKLKGEELERTLPFAALALCVRQQAVFPRMKFGSHPC